jgi:hypothetical protein
MGVRVGAAVTVGIALMIGGYAQAAKRVHRNHEVHYSGAGQGLPEYRPYIGNAAADGNNANSMSGSNSAVENANGRTNCC